MSKSISAEELTQHKSNGDAWIAVDGNVYDVSKFDHPGGKVILLKECGKDSSKKFHLLHDDSVLERHGKQMKIGILGDAKSPKEEASASPKALGDQFGELFPYAEPNWYQEFSSPYYNESHRKWRAMVRDFVEKELMPYVSEWEESYQMPASIYKKGGELGMLAGVVGHKWPTEYIGEGPVENYDSFHTHILIDEISRVASGGVIWGFFTGLMIGLPPIMNFGSEYLRKKVVADCLTGKKIICLCISEPWTASDVANLQTTATREGDHYIVNGAKKWITNGTFADYFTVAARTGPEDSGANGLSMFLLEKGMPGLSVRHMKCQGNWASGTTFITLENVRVPARNLIGKEGNGFRMIMHNFNHERWGLVIMSNRLARVCLEDAFKYALKRKTFGKFLIEHQAIRMKLADMARQIEAVHAWTENVTYQWKVMGEHEAMKRLGDTIALLKPQSSRVLELCVREAVHVFGGSAYVRSGVGEKVERIYRDAQGFSLPGGTEDILKDYAIRTATKKARKLKSNL